MLVKNIIKKSAELLGFKNVVNYLDGNIEADKDIEDDVKLFLIGVNMVNANVASSYMELIGSNRVIAELFNRISYSEISPNNSIIEIKKITKLNGESVSFKLFPDGVEVLSGGDLIIEYSYFPNEVSIDDSIDYYLKLNEIIFALGVVGEFLYIKGAIEEAVMWDKKFKQNMFNLTRPKRNIVMPVKEWK